MALTIANPDASTPVTPRVPGSRKHAVVKVTLDSSYPTGGYTLSASAVGLLEIRAAMAHVTAAGRLASFTLSGTTWSLKVFSAVATEVSNATDLSADSVFVDVHGI